MFIIGVILDCLRFGSCFFLVRFFVVFGFTEKEWRFEGDERRNCFSVFRKSDLGGGRS